MEKPQYPEALMAGEYFQQRLRIHSDRPESAIACPRMARKTGETPRL